MVRSVVNSVENSVVNSRVNSTVNSRVNNNKNNIRYFFIYKLLASPKHGVRSQLVLKSNHKEL